MQILRYIPIERIEPCVLALGNFDGVHIGHRCLLENAQNIAKSFGIASSVLIFDPHPLKFLMPNQGVELLTSLEERLDIFEQIGIDRVYLLPFNRQVASLSPEEFVRDILVRLRTVHVVVGFNYSFGYQGKGTPEDLQQFGEKYNFGVSVLQAQIVNEKIISSSSIRKALLHGDIKLTKTLLGRSPRLRGKVVKGEQRGRQLGFPTANLALRADVLVPKRGVYAVWAEIDGERYLGMMNIGMKPTFHNEYSVTVEVNFFDFQGNLYGKDLEINIEERIRDERKFNGFQELCEQLVKDKNMAKAVLQRA